MYAYMKQSHLSLETNILHFWEWQKCPNQVSILIKQYRPTFSETIIDSPFEIGMESLGIEL